MGELVFFRVVIVSLERYGAHVNSFGFVFKVERIQSYNQNGWNYIEKLHQFVDGGMSDESFINTVSEIVTGAVGSNVLFTGQRWANFDMLLTNLHLKGDQSVDGISYSVFRWSSAERNNAANVLFLIGMLLIAFTSLNGLAW
jgi:hypothetical protein